MYMRLYLMGYKGINIPRSIRRLFAKTKLHRAWIAGKFNPYSEQIDDSDYYEYLKNIP